MHTQFSKEQWGWKQAVNVPVEALNGLDLNSRVLVCGFFWLWTVFIVLSDWKVHKVIILFIRGLQSSKWRDWKHNFWLSYFCVKVCVVLYLSTDIILAEQCFEIFFNHIQSKGRWKLICYCLFCKVCVKRVQSYFPSAEILTGSGLQTAWVPLG